MATVSLTQFQPGSSPRAANNAMKSAVKTMAKAKHCAVVWFADIVQRKLFRELGYSSIYQYAQMELGFSSTRTGDFLRLAKRLDELPQLKQELEAGEIGYSAARELIKVASPQNEKVWLDEARKCTRDVLAEKVSLARDEAKNRAQENPNQSSLLAGPASNVPVAAVRHRVNLEMSSEQFARYEALWEKLHKMGGIPVGSGNIEAILEGLATLVDTAGQGVTAPVQIHVHKCPECEKATTATSRGEIPLTISEMERLECDAQIAEAGHPNKSSIPPAVKRNVLSRDRHRCQSPGCTSARFLEVHHIIPRSKGGSNKPENLVSLCGGCHQILHDRGTKYCPRGAKPNPLKSG